jgi:DNA-binding PadR family transcriptional regulator
MQKKKKPPAAQVSETEEIMRSMEREGLLISEVGHNGARRYRITDKGLAYNDLEAAAKKVLRALLDRTADLLTNDDGVTILRNHATGKDSKIAEELMDFMVALDLIERGKFQ